MEKLFSVKMRSSKNNVHISGAEKIVKESEIERTVLELLKRAREHSRGEPDFISLKVEELKEKPLFLKALPVFEVSSNLLVEKLLTVLFKKAGIPESLGLSVYNLILKGPSPSGKVMRGAMIVEVSTGKRLEPDKERGVRASYIDITPEAEKKLKQLAGEKYTENFKEALVLSSKVLNFNGVIAELCVSDDPDYTTGYFSISGIGYFRIFDVKPEGLPFGGRAFFVKPEINLKEFIEYIEKKPVIISEVQSYSSISIEGEELPE